jgi:formylglycine-generating enzyme required for sulfatase activity
MNRIFTSTVMILVFALGGIAQANVFNLGPGLTNLEVVTVGNPGNAADTHGIGYGSVSYIYNIGKYEVTAAQYTDFLNKVAKTDKYGLYNTEMWQNSSGLSCNIQRSGSSGSYSYTVAADWANRPVNYVSYWDAARFTNWLHNGQPTGDQNNTTTEDGAYKLNIYSTLDINIYTGLYVVRNAGAKWAMPTENEWYKAAYYSGIDGIYYDYPTQSNTKPSNVGSDGYIDPGNHANYWDYSNTIGPPYNRTNVGEFENSASAYGTFDQGGNVEEWNEGLTNDGYASRGLRGGQCGAMSDKLLASYRSYKTPYNEGAKAGFRVTQAYVPQAVPEPATLLGFGFPLLMIGLGRLRGLRK